MKKTLLLIVLLSTVGLVHSQTKVDKEAIEKEVNKQLWKPFKTAFDDRDAKLFNSLHTDDVLRVSKWGIKQGPEYKEGVLKSYEKKDAPKREIDFWLEHRIYAENIGYEIGYYRITSYRANNEVKVSYARFHIVLKKINGKWLIAQDWDTNNINGVAVTAEDFAKGVPLNL